MKIKGCLKEKKSFLWMYTALFAVMCLLSFAGFYLRGWSMIWTEDGIKQHYQALAYIGRWGRSILRGEGISLWDFHLGQGADILTTLNYYGIGDPLTLFSIFVPVRYTEYLYEALIILRLYLAGIAFAAFCFSMKKEKMPVLAGSMSYVFCGYALRSLMRHPFFLNPMIYLPLLLLGAERVIRKKRPTLFVVMVCISLVSNFYFFYMLAIGVVIYVVARYLTLEQKKNLKDFLQTVLRVFICAVVGVMMSAVIILPVVLLFVNTYRSEAVQLSDLLYSKEHYISLVYGFLIPDAKGGNYSYLGFTIPALAAIILLFRQKKKYRVLKGLVVLMSAMYLFPIVGRVMNGFSYPSDRWCFMYAMLISYVLVLMWQALVQSVTGIIRRRTQTVVMAVLCLHIFANASFCYLCNKPSYVPAGQAYARIQESGAFAIKESGLATDNDARYETDSIKPQNTCALAGVNGLDIFFSLVPAQKSERYMEMETLQNYTYQLLNNNFRTFLNATSGVGYFVKKNEDTPVPYGYEKITDEKINGHDIYKNQYTLPLGYTSDSYLTKAQYDSLHAINKQEALLQGILLNDTEEIKQNVKQAEPVFTAKKMDYSIEVGDGIALNMGKGTFRVKKKGAEIKLKFRGLTNAETYVRFQGLKTKTDASHWSQKDQMIKVTVKAKGYSTTLRSYTPYYLRPNGQTEYSVNMGYHKEALNTVTIKFKKQCCGSVEDLSVYCQPMDQYETQIEALKENVLEDVKLDNNRVTGDITLEKDKILCLMIPYDKGWTAYVDGKEAKITRANTMYMALPLTKGEHRVELRYTTYGLKTGFVITLIGLAGFALILLYCKKKSAKNTGDEPDNRRE